MQIVSKPAKNFTVGRHGYKPEAIIIHTANCTLQQAKDKFSDQNSKSSCHYMIGKAGEVWRFVQEQDSAWHAGGVVRPTWQGIKAQINPNFYTIGIQHEGTSGEKWTIQMYASSAMLIANVCNYWNIAIDAKHIIPYSSLNTVSKLNDPGSGVNIIKLIELAQAYCNSNKPTPAGLHTIKVLSRVTHLTR